MLDSTNFILSPSFNNFQFLFLIVIFEDFLVSIIFLHMFRRTQYIIISSYYYYYFYIFYRDVIPSSTTYIKSIF